MSENNLVPPHPGFFIGYLLAKEQKNEIDFLICTWMNEEHFSELLAERWRLSNHDCELFAKFFWGTPDVYMNFQTSYDEFHTKTWK